jgi:transcription elongation factor GreA
VRSSMAKEFKLSPERFKELKDELVYLKTVREKEVAEQIKEARSFGDLSENSEYDEAKNEQGKLYSRIAEVENILENCVVIEEEVHDGKTVRLGSKLKVLDVEFDEELDYEVVGSQEADPMNGRISEDSPFGRALLGKCVGEDVVVEAPAGALHYRVLSISK